MFIATVSSGPAVSVPRGQDAEQAVNSTGSGEKGLCAPARILGMSPGVSLCCPTRWCGILRDVLVHPCFVPAESVTVCLGIPIRKQKEGAASAKCSLQNVPCKIFPAKYSLQNYPRKFTSTAMRPK